MNKFFTILGIFLFSISIFFSNSGFLEAHPTSRLYLSTTEQQQSVGDSFFVSVRVDAAESINVVRSVVEYDPEFFKVIDIQVDGAWPNTSPGNFIDNERGVLSHGGYLLVDSVTGDQQFATIEFQSLAVGDTSIAIQKDNSVLAGGDMINHLDTVEGIEITIEEVPEQLEEDQQEQAPQEPVVVNNAPIIDIGEQIGYIGQELSFTVNTSDPDGDIVTLSANNLPEGADFDALTGEFSWIPSLQDIYLITFTATDDSDLGPKSSSRQVRLTVFCSNPETFGGQPEELSCPAEEELSCPVCYEDTQVFANVSQKKFDPHLTSPSHPDTNKWYSSDLVHIRWNHDPESLGSSVSFNQDPDADPSSAYFNTTNNFITYNDVPSGIWYFHLKIKYEDGWSKTHHLKVKIDTHSPDLLLSDLEVGDENFDIFFNAQDNHSGIDVLEYRVNRGEWLPAENPLTINRNQKGLLDLRVMDYATNVSEVSISLDTYKRIGQEKKYTLFIPPTETLSRPIVNEVVTHKIVRSPFTSQVLLFTGTSDPNTQVQLFFTHDKRIILTTESDSRGDWQAVYDKHLDPGTYTLFAIAQKGELQSPMSEAMTFTIDEPLVAQNTFPWIVFALGVVVTILTFGLVGVMYKIITKKNE